MWESRSMTGHPFQLISALSRTPRAREAPAQTPLPTGALHGRRGGVGLREVGVAETIEVRAAHEDLRRDLAGDVLHEVRGHVGEVRVEVRVVRRDAHAVGADQPGR